MGDRDHPPKAQPRSRTPSRELESLSPRRESRVQPRAAARSNASIAPAGSLQRTPLAHLLVRLWTNGQSGTLFVHCTTGDARVSIRGGLPLAGNFRAGVATFDDGMFEILRSEEAYTFYGDRDFLDPGRALPGDGAPLALLMRWLRTGETRKDAEEHVLGQCGESATLELVDSHAIDLMNLGVEERVIVARIERDRPTLGDLARTAPTGEEKARRLVYALLIAAIARPVVVKPEESQTGDSHRKPTVPRFRAIEQIRDSLGPKKRATLPPLSNSSEPSRPPVVSSSPPHSNPPAPTTSNAFLRPPASSSPSFAAPRPSARASSGAPPLPRPMPSQPPFPPGRRSSVPGPDGLRAPSAGATTDRLRATSAHEALRAAAERAAGTRAYAEFHRAQKLMARGRFGEASPILAEVLRIEGAEPDYHAAAAWCRFMASDKGPIALEECIVQVNEALRRNPDHTTALYYKGVFLKTSGKEQLAIQHFTRCVRTDPNHIDAARELFRLRKGRDRKGSFTDLFGKKR